MKSIWQDLRYSLMSLYSRPGFSLTLTGILCLGISSVTVMLTLIQSVLLNQLPLNGSERLVIVSGAAAPPGGDALEWWSQNESFTGLCQYRAGGVNLADESNPVRVSAAVISASFFSVFDVRPQQGRPFQADDETPGGNRSVIVSHRFQVGHFRQDDKVIGATLTLNGMTHTVIGVMPAEFSYPGRTDLWIPRAAGEAGLELGSDEQTEGELPSSLRFRMIGLLRPGVSPAQAQARLNALFIRLQELSAKAGLNPGAGVKLTPLKEVYVRDFRTAFWSLLAGVGLLLLVACANAASLLVVQSVRRRKEIATRLCFGASLQRVARQLCIEGLLLAALSGMAGVLLSVWLVDLIRMIWAGVVPRLAEARISLPVLLMTLAVSALAGLSINLSPVLMVHSINLVEVLKEGGSKTSLSLSRRIRHALVVIEIALTLVLLVGAGLAIRSFIRLTDVDPGFDSAQVLTASIALPKAKYGSPPAAEKPTQFPASAVHQRLQEEVRSLPGVIAVGSVSRLPLSSSVASTWVEVPGTPGCLAAFSSLSGDYFKAMGIRLIGGRAFTEHDSAIAPKAVIISETLARQFWPGSNPVGQTLLISGESAAREIVGVVADVRQGELNKAPEPQLYLPYSQPFRGQPPPLNMLLVMRTSTDPNAVIGELQNRIAALDQTLPLFNVRTMDEVISASASAWRFRGILAGSFALAAWLLALAGIYSVVAYSVAARTQEISIRLALGAMPGNILVMVLREAAVLLLTGVVIGAVVAMGLSRYLASLLYGINPADQVTLLGAVLVIAAGTLLAAIVPAWSACRTNPASALRSE